MSTSDGKINYAIFRIHKLVRAQIQQLVKEFGITNDQWVVLSTVYNAEKQYSQRELAKACVKETAAITRMIDLMEKNNWVKRVDSPVDRRIYLIEITAVGRNLYEKTLEPIIEFEQHVTEKFSEEDLRNFTYLLEKYEESVKSFE